MLPRADVEKQLEMIDAALAGREQEIIARGSGWAALEDARLQREGRGISAGDLVFDEASLTDEQRPWLTLLNTGVFPERDPAEAPLSWMVQDEWRAMLEASVAAGRSDHWGAWMQLGVMRFYIEDIEGAKAAWQKSIALKPSAWALRCLALLAEHNEKIDEALSLYTQAIALLPGVRMLAIEYGKLLVKAEKFADVLTWIASLPAALAAEPRIRTFEVASAIGVGDCGRAEVILMSDLVVPDIREGEVSLSDLWFKMVATRMVAKKGIGMEEALEAAKKTALPMHLDFRMQA